ncbi:ABC-2 type transport system ATP-binding protein [Motilibacter rhizosphaerae]|uniref:ABC-2 type transport system ATP-binding protein n=1 Tax=Motilibacter rhizosphaerae TaxID=598652 RepID=A0A4Q7NV16_9ACTN|nr:alpha/beta fold hydrolase [Motilibacter rhizosphaerae]RZS91027.1 ABC-2 type transport system ATP-binding protein [Motilibacter rhizosphaerae]
MGLLRGRRRWLAAALVLVVVVAAVLVLVGHRGPGYRTQDATVRVLTGPDGRTPVDLDTRLYLPDGASAASPVPAVLLAHGFGGTKLSESGDARHLVRRGYAVLTWTAEGFGRSGGQIHLDSIDWEAKDVSRLIDRLAARPDIAKRGGDPVVAVVGGSYGGAVSLLAAGTDHRIDAIVPSITWNDLGRALLPNHADGAAPGVFKSQWAGLLFGAGSGDLTSGLTTGSTPTPSPVLPSGTPAGSPGCGRFAADVCAAYQELAVTGRATAATDAILARSSPRTVTSRITAPTLVIQGEGDSLFPLDEGAANAREIAATGTPVQVFWFTGGHDAGDGTRDDQERVTSLTDRWLDHYLRGEGPTPSTGFTFSRVSGIDETAASGNASTAYAVAGDPGTDGTGRVDVALPTRSAQIASPPRGTPSAITSLPLAGGLGAFTGSFTLAVPGQHADVESAPLARSVTAVGAPTVRVRVASPTGDAVLYLALYDVDPSKVNGRAVLPQGLVAPVRLTGLPRSLADARPVQVRLPAVAYRFAAGHRLRLTIATSDQAHLGPTDPRTYTVAVDGPVALPTVDAHALPAGGRGWRIALLVLVAALALAVALAVLLARRRQRLAARPVDEAASDVPLVVRGLRKEYADGFVAAARVDFAVPRERVVGLLGPNGAGKTTTLRMLMGLTRPTRGEVLVFGQRLVPGAPVLERVGALVEGPGFLPHLSGRRNLELYWRSTGRPAAEARMEEALAIAGLGAAVERRTGKYSHGMRQRLAIAQAMLGLPELLVLDEPTDGLDPPQIAAMRQVLRDYAREGRAVLVSSHLLAEVEQMCTDVVVMNRGEVVASGTVEELVGDSPTVLLDVDDGARAGQVLDGLGLVWSDEEDELVVETAGRPVALVVAALVEAGVGVRRVQPRRRLEDAFLALVGGDTRGSGDR